MRTNTILVEGMENIKTLLQYLYMDEENYIIVENDMGIPLKISMDENGRFECANMHFPDVPPMKNYDFPVPSMLAAIKQLEGQRPDKFPDRFKNRWEEIKELTLMNVASNRN